MQKGTFKFFPEFLFHFNFYLKKAENIKKKSKKALKKTSMQKRP